MLEGGLMGVWGWIGIYRARERRDGWIYEDGMHAVYCKTKTHMVQGMNLTSSSSATTSTSISASATTATTTVTESHILWFRCKMGKVVCIIRAYLLTHTTQIPLILINYVRAHVLEFICYQGKSGVSTVVENERERHWKPRKVTKPHVFYQNWRFHYY